MTLQPPLQLTIAPQLIIAFASSLQLPLQVPLQEPSQWAGVPGVIMHAASQLPLQVPAHIPVLGIAVPPEAVHVPLQLPMHVPSQWTVGAMPGVHVPVQSAWQEPWHCACTVADPSQVALALHIASHSPESSPGMQATVTSGGVQFAMPLHEPSHDA